MAAATKSAVADLINRPRRAGFPPRRGRVISAARGKALPRGRARADERRPWFLGRWRSALARLWRSWRVVATMCSWSRAPMAVWPMRAPLWSSPTRWRARRRPSDPPRQRRRRPRWRAISTRWSFQCWFTGEFDHGDAIVTIKPGQGGLEAQDWTFMPVQDVHEVLRPPRLEGHYQRLPGRRGHRHRPSHHHGAG